MSDIRINGERILYGSQIAETITMALMATAVDNAGVQQAPVGRTQGSTSPKPYVAVLQAWDVFEAYRQLEINAARSLLFLPRPAFNIEVGETISNVALMLSTGQAPADATFTVSGSGVTIAVNGSRQVLNTRYHVFLVTITASSTAALGDRTVLANVPGQTPTTAGAIGLLAVTPASVQDVPLQLDSSRGRF
ncbi:hypothetical protein [Mitsuaria sp. GD03876]|uniref:hypothetical protein n=1 Tax=Mitsuaria sp. GD03876 TaxID=2975399 RepID=UPI002448BB3A|nr:hypothetical protein [Mitsuaria sp. GD03876]MDH0865649.1 hypothetical protein [Mitsuaria sp. GD03876]